MKHISFFLAFLWTAVIGAAADSAPTLRDNSSIKTLQTLCAQAAIANRPHTLELIQQLPDVINTRHDKNVTGPLIELINNELLKRTSAVTLHRGLRPDQLHCGTGSVAYNPKNDALFIGFSDGSLQSYHPKTSTHTQPLQIHNKNIRSIAFSRDNEMFATGSEDGVINIWNNSSGECMQRIQCPRGSWLLCLTFNPDSNMLASASHNSAINLWDPKTGNLVSSLHGHTDAVSSISFSFDGKLLASGSHDRTIRLWTSITGICLRILRGHTGYVNSIAFHPGSGTVLASGSTDRTLRLWNCSTGNLMETLHDNSDYKDSDPDEWVDDASLKGYLTSFWNGLTGKEPLPSHATSIKHVAFSPDGNMLASSGNVIKLWNYPTRSHIQTIQTPYYFPTSCMAFNFDGSTLACGSHGMKTNLWQINFYAILVKFLRNAEMYQFLIKAVRDWNNNQPHEVDPENNAYQRLIQAMPQCDNFKCFVFQTEHNRQSYHRTSASKRLRAH